MLLQDFREVPGWEYKELVASIGMDDILRSLNQMGKEGWECIDVWHLERGVIFLLKRRTYQNAKVEGAAETVRSI
jgi:hypothetical protein